MVWHRSRKAAGEIPCRFDSCTLRFRTELTKIHIPKSPEVQNLPREPPALVGELVRALGGRDKHNKI